MADNMIEAREELLLSPSSSETAIKLPQETRYNGWRPPTKEWKKWVKKLQPKFEYLWIQTGIYHAIKASTYEIKRDDDLILELAARWCSNTNTFSFPWGESTITLEDTKVCFGYSLVGCSVSIPLMDSEQVKVEEELMEARRMFNKSKAKKVNQRAWMMYFMETESKVEHEAFLVYWLSRFVLPADAYDTILKSVIPTAIHLANGNRIALAPAVLASIYRDLNLLNSVITKNATMTMKSLRVTIWAPFQLIQIWALERFLALNPRPYTIWHGLPKVARWSGVKVLKNKNLKNDLDIAGFVNGFLWQPYENSPSVEVYNERDVCKCYNPWWNQSKSSEEGDNKRMKVEKHEMECSNERGHFSIH
ncbi:protein MAIN-LIKE 2-like [Vicia villosa]|uniref:protein MAIN-LIKE 2-like n=1 Tax=Vicia villosa TaxID=3911 RepID=UPI00273B23FE|nr:protein MAIN-LIKE 2-like [Vicia villosa]